MMNLRSLRFRVTAWSVGFLAVALSIFSVAVYLGVRQFLAASQQRNLRNMTRNIETTFLSSYGRHGETWAVGEIREDFPGGADRYVRILHDGREIYRSGDLKNPPFEITGIPLPGNGVRGVVHLPDIAGGMIQLVDQYTSPEGLHFTVITGATEAAAQRVLRSIALILCAVCPIVIILAAIACFILMARPLRPVLVLTQQAEHIGRDHLGERLHVPATGDEVQRLATALNRMIERLEDALAHNHRFSADASHELRTPLTILRGELEQAIQEPGLSDTVIDSIGSALEEIERMSQIVQSLMATAYLDSGGEKIERRPTDLGGLVGSTIEQMQLLAEERKITLLGDTLAPEMISGNRTRIKQVIVNLLDNAMKYNRVGGTVTASVFLENERVILRVADTGIGIPSASLPFIFDRFYRADKARSRATGGIGIGLAIVKAICKAHSATIDVQSREDQGTVFIVAFPKLTEEYALPALAAAPARASSSLSSKLP
jgi:signal transduction histidine kinase